MLQKLLIISTLFHLELDTRWFSFFIALNNFLTKFPYVILQKNSLLLSENHKFRHSYKTKCIKINRKENYTQIITFNALYYTMLTSFFFLYSGHLTLSDKCHVKTRRRRNRSADFDLKFSTFDR